MRPQPPTGDRQRSSPAKSKLGRGRQRRDGERADEKLGKIESAHAGGDQLAEPAAADEGGERRCRDDLDRGGADAGEHHRQGERDLDAPA